MAGHMAMLSVTGTLPSHAAQHPTRGVAALQWRNASHLMSQVLHLRWQCWQPLLLAPPASCSCLKTQPLIDPTEACASSQDSQVFPQRSLAALLHVVSVAWQDGVKVPLPEDAVHAFLVLACIGAYPCHGAQMHLREGEQHAWQTSCMHLGP